MKNLYLIGAGGHCKSCIDVIESTKKYSIKGLFDLPENKGKKIGPYEILGGDDEIKRYVSAQNEFVITLGQIKTAELRMKVAALLASYGAQIATIISPRAYVSGSAVVGEGTMILHDALVNSEARVGRHCILNTKSLVEHDAVVEDFCHVSTGAILNGNTHVKQKSFVGSLSVLQEGLVVPEGSVLSAGLFHQKNRVPK